MKAGNLMVPLQEYLEPGMTLKEASNILRRAKRGEERHGAKGLPVLDVSGNMVGFLSIRDILKAVFPSYMTLMDMGDFTWEGMVEDLARKAGGRTVSELMTSKVISVSVDAPLMECIDHMLKNHVNKLPVLGHDGGVAGILYEKDVFLAITRLLDGDTGGGG